MVAKRFGNQISPGTDLLKFFSSRRLVSFAKLKVEGWYYQNLLQKSILVKLGFSLKGMADRSQAVP
jgi:hypothetical protein